VINQYLQQLVGKLKRFRHFCRKSSKNKSMMLQGMRRKELQERKRVAIFKKKSNFFHTITVVFLVKLALWINLHLCIILIEKERLHRIVQVHSRPLDRMSNLKVVNCEFRFHSSTMISISILRFTKNHLHL
jgi:hypothetical protein